MVEQKRQGTLVNPDELEDGVGSKGIQFDPDVLYTFTLTSMEARKIKKAGEAGHEGKEFTVIETQNTEEGSDAQIRMSFFHNKKVRINEDDKEHEDDAVKFARGMGYPVGIGVAFKWKEIFRVGQKFTAHVKPQIRKMKQPDGSVKEVETGFSEIDLMTVKSTKGGSKPAAKQAAISGSAADIETVVGMAAGYPNKGALITGLNQAKMSNLIQLAIQLDNEKKLTYMGQ